MSTGVDVGFVESCINLTCSLRNVQISTVVCIYTLHLISQQPNHSFNPPSCIWHLVWWCNLHLPACILVDGREAKHRNIIYLKKDVMYIPNCPFHIIMSKSFRTPSHHTMYINHCVSQISQYASCVKSGINMENFHGHLADYVKCKGRGQVV